MNDSKELITGFYDSESEKAILGSLILDNELYFLVSDIIKENDFYNTINQRLYIEIKEMILASAKVDLVSLRSWLKEKNLFEQVGGITYLSSLCESITTTSNSEEYAKNIKKKSILRRLFQHLQVTNFGVGSNLSEFLSELDTKINEFTGELTFNDARPNSEVIEEILQEIKIARKQEEKIFGISTGFIKLDNITSGLRKKEMWLIAGRPSQGKTLTAINIAINITKKLTPVLFLSPEQSQKQLLQRSLANLTGINLTKIRTGDIFNNDIYEQAFLPVIPTILKLPLFIDDRPLSLSQALYKIKKAKKRYGIEVVILDHLSEIKEILSATGNDKVNIIGQGAREIHNLGKELNISTILLSQLNRAVEHRDNKRPMLSDLRDSGRLEEIGDMILFLYRDEYYNKNTNEPGIMEVIVAKGRDCDAGTMIKLRCEKEFMRLSDNISERNYYDRD